jgi:hypothetical protein
MDMTPPVGMKKKDDARGKKVGPASRVVDGGWSCFKSVRPA